MRKNALHEAQADFEMAVKIDPQKFSGYIGLGDCQRARGDYSQAIKNYTLVIEQEDHLLEIIGLKRVACYMAMKEYALAEKDIQKVSRPLKQDPRGEPKKLRRSVQQGLLGADNGGVREGFADLRGDNIAKHKRGPDFESPPRYRHNEGG